MNKQGRRTPTKSVGLFDSDNPQHILNKLEADYQRVSRVPNDRHAFMDFISTANILISWTRKQSGLSPSSNADKILLDVCRELANNLKHYYKEEALVSDIVVGGAFDPQLFDSAAFDTGELLLELQGDAKKHLGEKLRTDAFAKKVLDFWRAYFRTP
jgi:hypothetical protein